MDRIDLKPLRNKDSLTERVYKELKHALNAGTFRPGERLTGRAVADALGVSLTPAREAIGRLTAEGGLEAAGPRTIIVPAITLERYEEILEIRILLEGLAAEAAARNSDPEFVQTMTHIQEEYGNARREWRFRDALRLNERFHFTLYHRSGKEKLVSILESLWLFFGPLLSHLYPKYVDDESGVIPHQKVLQGLHENDPAKVRRAIVEDLETGAHKIRQLLADMET
jgi:DNA-binding GntR family transcriptional regulator